MKKIVNYSLALMISTFALTACSTPNTTPNGTNNTQNNSTNLNGSTSINTQVTLNQNVSDIVSYMEDEATLSDSADIMAKSGFSVKGLLGDIKATTEAKTSTTISLPTKEEVKEKVGEKLDKAVDSGKMDASTAKKVEVGINYMLDNQVVKNELVAQGIITLDASGSVSSVDKTKLKAYIKTKKEQLVSIAKSNEDKIKIKVDEMKVKFSAQLEAKTGVSTDDLKNKASKVAKSDVVKVTNPDGSVTQTMTVNFTTPNGKVTKDNKIIRTADSKGNLISLEHYMTVDNTAITKTVSKTTTINADGSRKVVTNSTTTWKKSERTRQISEERTISADGNATGTGTVTITEKGKEPIVKTLNVTSTNGKVTMTSGDTDNGSSIKVEQSVNSQAQVAVKEEGKSETTSSVNVETVTETESSVS